MDTVTFESEPVPLSRGHDALGIESLTEVDATPNPIEPFVLLGSQWEGGHAAGMSGEKRLMAAVLADAIRLYLKHARSCTVSGRMLFRDTAGWIESRDRGWLLAYESVCDVLGIDAEQLRIRLRALATSDVPTAVPYDAGRLRIGRGRKVRV